MYYSKAVQLFFRGQNGKTALQAPYLCLKFLQFQDTSAYCPVSACNGIVSCRTTAYPYSAGVPDPLAAVQ